MSDQVMSQAELDDLLSSEGLSGDAAPAPRSAPGDEAPAEAAAVAKTPSAPPAEEEAPGPSADELAGWGLSPGDLNARPVSPSGPAKHETVHFDALHPGAAAKPAREMDFILDIPLQLTVEVGRSTIEIGELLQLGPGSIVELDKLAGEPLEIFANDKLVARGEAVIVNEKFGIRLTDVVSKHDRIENLH